jgi:hypothetical protein
MQLSPDHGDIDQAIAEFVSAAFSPEEREIARLKARIEQLRPRSHARVILHNEILAVRLRQLGAKWPA